MHRWIRCVSVQAVEIKYPSRFQLRISENLLESWPFRPGEEEGLRDFEEAAPLALLQPVTAALFTVTPAEATPISSLVTRLSGGDATAISKYESNKTTYNFITLLIG